MKTVKCPYCAAIREVEDNIIIALCNTCPGIEMLKIKEGDVNGKRK